MNKQFSHAATILQVKDPLASAKWYRDRLGFDITFEWGDPVDYVVTKGEEAVSVHFSKGDGKPNDIKMALYIFVHDVDALYQILKAQSVEVRSPIVTHDYGMRDFDVIDPDGYVLCFGTHVERLNQ